MSDELLRALDQAGVRLTGPRREIAALIAKRNGHFTAADLIADAGKRRLGVGRATIFRLLDLLAEQGLVERVDLPDGRHAYVPCEPSHHHHLVCVQCGRTEEFESAAVLAAGEQAATTLGFLLLECVLNVRSLCPQCRRARAG
jgi:Fur family ferric uptake transcriptional regulator